MGAVEVAFKILQVRKIWEPYYIGPYIRRATAQLAQNTYRLGIYNKLCKITSRFYRL